MSSKVGSARIDENGRITGGKAGDQTGKEVSTQSWYKHSKGWRVFRAINPAAAEKIAQDMQWACDNAHIGYDQGQRNTLYTVSKPLGFDCQKVKTNCETDCSGLVRVCCAYAGIMLPAFNTVSEASVLLASGAFKELKGAKYTDSPDYQMRGDILVTKSKGHTVVVLDNGSKVKPQPAPEPSHHDLQRGDSGEDVRRMQLSLLRWDAKCLPKYGPDGDFGAETERAVKAFQASGGLPVTGIYDEATDKALNGSVSPKYVLVTGESVSIRSAPGAQHQRVGIVHKGDRLPYQDETHMLDDTPWYLIIYNGDNGWISGKYSELEG